MIVYSHLPEAYHLYSRRSFERAYPYDGCDAVISGKDSRPAAGAGGRAPATILRTTTIAVCRLYMECF